MLSLDPLEQARSWLLFEKLHVEIKRLSANVDEWINNNKYKRMTEFLEDLKVVLKPVLKD